MGKIQYIVGSIFRKRVLQRSKVNNCKIFILANQFAQVYEKDDTFAILSTKTLYRFDNSNKIYAQIVSPNFLFNSWADWNVVMSTQSFKMGIIIFPYK